MFNDITQLLQLRVTMATKISCNLIGAIVYRRQAQLHVLQVTRPSLPGVGLAPRDYPPPPLSAGHNRGQHKGTDVEIQAQVGYTTLKADVCVCFLESDIPHDPKSKPYI